VYTGVVSWWLTPPYGGSLQEANSVVIGREALPEIPRILKVLWLGLHERREREMILMKVFVLFLVAFLTWLAREYWIRGKKKYQCLYSCRVPL
jgi:hypothetical protein